MLARGKIIYIATIMHTNRDLAHKSQNEDKFPIFFFGLELLNEAEKEKKNGEGDSASAPSRFALLSEGEMQQIYLQLTNSYFAKYFAYREQSLLILLSVFRVGFDAQFHRLCYKTVGSCLPVHYRVMQHVGSFGYCLGQLLRFFCALETSHVLHYSIVHAKA